MLRLRPYRQSDAKIILSWCRDEAAFRRWSADRYPQYPIEPDDMNRLYQACTPESSLQEGFYPMTAFDESGVVGHLILRYTDAALTTVRFGYVIVDDAKRGRGVGKEILRLALKYAFELLQAEKVTLGVFENNEQAARCYRAVGFEHVAQEKPEVCELCGERWVVQEMALTRAAFRANEIKQK